MKIAHKLLLSFSTIVLLIWVVGYLGISTGQESLKTQIGESSALFAAEILKDIDKNIHSKIELFQEYSRNLTLQQTVSESNLKFEKIDNMQAYITQKDQEWAFVPKETITPFMQQLMSNRLSKGLLEKANFYDIKREFKAFGEIFITNKYGANVAQTGKTTDYRQDDEQWWQKAKTDGVTVSDVEYDESADIYSADIVIRIDDKHGKFMGVIKVVVNVEEVIETVKTAERKLGYQTARLRLMNKKGQAIYCQHHKFLENLSDHPAFPKIVGDQGYFTAKATNSNKGESLYVYAVLKDYKEFKSWGWVLLIEYGTADIFAPVAQFRKKIFTISLAVTIFAVLMSIFISRHISHPITRLKTAAIAVGLGNLDIEIQAESNGEVGQLAETFNKMVKDLKMTTTSIAALNAEIVERKQAEEALRERTGELKERVKELNCLFGISNIVDKPQIAFVDIFQGIVELLPFSLQYPEITCARIVMENQVYKTENFRKTTWRLTNEIAVSNQRIGAVEVYYLEAKPQMDAGPFMKEEKHLIKIIAQRLGHIYERNQAKEEKKQFEAQLLQSEKMASIGQLAAGVAHEINNPTGFVSSNLKTLSDYIKDINNLIKEYRILVAELQENAPADAVYTAVSEPLMRIKTLEDEMDIAFVLNDIMELIEESREGSERIKNIVQDLKDFAHPGENTLKFADINQGLSSTINVVWHEIKYKAEVVKDFGDLPQVQCYPQMLNQVFMNILVNAAQAIKEHGEIRIRTSADNGYVKIKISDTGSGISQENLSKIFDPFFTTKDVGQGTGLGMHVAYNIIQKHHGLIDVESKVGAGTTVTLQIPTEGLGVGDC